MEFLAGFHPLIIHFPIAFFLLYFLLELISVFFARFEDAALLVLFLGVVAGIAAVLTGNQAADFFIKNFSADATINNAIENHEFFATLLIWYFFGILIYRYYLRMKQKLNRKMKFVLLALALVGSFLVFETGNVGGKLVYEFGIGISKNIK